GRGCAGRRQRRRRDGGRNRDGHGPPASPTPPPVRARSTVCPPPALHRPPPAPPPVWGCPRCCLPERRRPRPGIAMAGGASGRRPPDPFRTREWSPWRPLPRRERGIRAPDGASDTVATMSDRVRLGVDGAVATITNDNPGKHNAFDDEMDQQLFAILAELKAR